MQKAILWIVVPRTRFLPCVGAAPVFAQCQQRGIFGHGGPVSVGELLAVGRGA